MVDYTLVRILFRSHEHETANGQICPREMSENAHCSSVCGQPLSLKTEITTLVPALALIIHSRRLTLCPNGKVSLYDWRCRSGSEVAQRICPIVQSTFIIEMDDAQARSTTSPLGNDGVGGMHLKLGQPVKVSKTIVHLWKSGRACNRFKGSWAGQRCSCKVRKRSRAVGESGASRCKRTRGYYATSREERAENSVRNRIHTTHSEHQHTSRAALQSTHSFRASRT